MSGPHLIDRVKETTTTEGTGALTLLGAVSGFQSFAAVGDANTCYYAIVHRTAFEWEVGIGTFTAAGTLLSRDSVLQSSNSNNPVNFSAGTKDVFITIPGAVVEALIAGTAAAIHRNAAGEISTVAEKTAPHADDLLLIEDSESDPSNAKKRLKIGNLAGGGGSAENVFEFDDFVTNEAVNQYKFAYLFGSNPTRLAPEANHPGIIRLSSGVGGNSMNPCFEAPRSFLPVDPFTLTFVVRPNGTANANYQVGARGAIAWPTNNAIFVEALTTDTNWHLVTRSGGTSTRIDTGIAASDATWYKITIYRKDASTIAARVNGGSEVTSTTNIPTAALDPFAQLIVASGTQTYDVDYWSFANTLTRF